MKTNVAGDTVWLTSPAVERSVVVGVGVVVHRSYEYNRATTTRTGKVRVSSRINIYHDGSAHESLGPFDEEITLPKAMQIVATTMRLEE